MDMSAVGNAAQASKDATGLNGDEVFSGKVNISRSDNGGFILGVGYERKKQGNARNELVSTYCPDKQLTFDSWDAASQAIDKLYGGGGGSTDAIDAREAAEPGA